MRKVRILKSCQLNPLFMYHRSRTEDDWYHVKASVWATPGPYRRVANATARESRDAASASSCKYRGAAYTETWATRRCGADNARAIQTGRRCHGAREQRHDQCVQLRIPGCAVHGDVDHQEVRRGHRPGHTAGSQMPRRAREETRPARPVANTGVRRAAGGPAPIDGT